MKWRNSTGGLSRDTSFHYSFSLPFWSNEIRCFKWWEVSISRLIILQDKVWVLFTLRENQWGTSISSASPVSSFQLWSVDWVRSWKIKKTSHHYDIYCFCRMFLLLCSKLSSLEDVATFLSLLLKPEASYYWGKIWSIHFKNI